MIRSHVLICGGTGCSSSGSVKLSEKLAEELKAKEVIEKHIKGGQAIAEYTVNGLK